jgi:hypothetical protein
MAWLGPSDNGSHSGYLLIFIQKNPLDKMAMKNNFFRLLHHGGHQRTQFKGIEAQAFYYRLSANLLYRFVYIPLQLTRYRFLIAISLSF